MLGDKGYIDDELLSPELKAEKDIVLIPLRRKNSKIQYPKSLSQLVFKARRRIKTTASQLVGQLSIERVLAKCKLGLIARINIKLLPYNLCCFINKIMGFDMEISKIKHLVFG